VGSNPTLSAAAPTRRCSAFGLRACGLPQSRARPAGCARQGKTGEALLALREYKRYKRAVQQAHLER
jgi:hypothetical protein